MPSSKIGQDELSQACWTDAPVKVDYDGSVASVALELGKFYYVRATSACHYLQGASNVAATTSSHYLPAGAFVAIRVTNVTTNGYVAFIKAAGSSAGSAYLSSPSNP
jgi:hypothetical protein